jgi:hypothetical protein
MSLEIRDILPLNIFEDFVLAKQYSREQLESLLVDPREDLNIEIKNWLDLQNNISDKAILAKAILALSNHGGGFILLGLRETPNGTLESEGRPAVLDGYSQDLINGIVQNYCDPPFHCAVHIGQDPTGAFFPIVIVPGGHRVPVRAKRSGPNGNIVTTHAIYIRKPGPRSETPQSAQDWDGLLERCLRNRRDDMLDQIRELITGAVPQVEQPAEKARLEEWIGVALQRWRLLIEPLPKGVGPRLSHGRYYFAYEIIGDRRQIAHAHLPYVLRNSVVQHSGWPPFWYSTRRGMEPYLLDDVVECWLGGGSQIGEELRDPAHSDFWRIHREGLAFLLRGLQEDGQWEQRNGRAPVQPGTLFDLTLPVWRVGETLLHARSLATNLFEGPTTIRFTVTYEGLAGRSLTSINGRRDVRDGRKARQDSISLETHVHTQAIDANLPEIVHPLLSPLYALFDFFELPMQLVVDELRAMRAVNF